jgi:hypothetical protein
MDIHAELTGPEFLDAVADAESSSGNYLNASEYRRRAHQWKGDQEALRRAQERCQSLEDTLTDIRRQTTLV